MKFALLNTTWFSDPPRAKTKQQQQKQTRNSLGNPSFVNDKIGFCGD